MNQLIRKLLSLLKRKESSNKEENIQGDIPILWEDNYCQREIVPRKNQEFIQTQIHHFRNLSRKINTGLGFTEAYERDAINVRTLSEEIRANYLENLLLSFEFKKARQVRYEGGKILSCEDGKTNAFSLSSFTFFFERENEFVQNIWIEVGHIISVKEFALIENVLHSLGKDLNLILVDWNSLEIVDLANKREVKRYLVEYWKKI